MEEKKGHRYFSATFFNRVWNLLDKAERTPDEDELMCEMAHASLAHWLCRDDCTAQNRSISYWQLSRVYATLERSRAARVYGEKCLDVSRDPSVEPFYLGYAYEAMARAAMISNDWSEAANYRADGLKIAEKVEDEESRMALLADLKSIEST